MRIVVLILLSAFLLSCSQANTTGSVTEREYNIKIHNTGELYIYTPFDVVAETKETPKIKTDNDPTTRNNANASLAGQGATATGAVGEAVKQALEGVESVSRRILKDSHNTSTSTSTAPSNTNKDKVKPIPKEEVKTKSNIESSSLEGLDVTWLHTDISTWPVTSKLSAVEVKDGLITLKYDKANVWPGVGSKNINANPWIIVEQNGRLYAATWEWLRKGQKTKRIEAVSGSHIKRDPLRDFKPLPGKVYGFMVSGLARDMAQYSNVKERSNIVWIRWPKL